MPDPRNFPRFHPREPIPAEELRRLERLAHAVEGPSVGGPGTQADDAGLSFFPPAREPGMWLQITGLYSGSQARYNGTEVVDDGNGSWVVPGSPRAVTGGAAHEVTGDGAVPVDGSVVRWARPAPGGGWSFLYVPPDAEAVVKVTSGTSGTITLTGGSVSGYPAVLESYSSATGAWSDGAACWFVGANGEPARNGGRYLARQVGQDASGVPIYSTECGLDVQSSTGSPDYPGTFRLQFDPSTFTLSQPSAGVVKVVGSSGITGIAVLQDGSPGVNSTAEINFLNNGHAGFVVTNVTGNATVDLAWAVYAGGGASLQLGVLNCNFTQLATNQFFNQNGGGSGWYAFATSRISGLADYAFGIQDGFSNYPCFDLVQATPTGGSVTGYVSVGAHLLIAANAAPAHFNSPGIVGQLVADGGGNLYVCYATDRWAKINSDSISF